MPFRQAAPSIALASERHFSANGNGADALIDGLASDTLFGGVGNDFFFATQAQLLGGSGGDVDHFEGGAGFDTLVLLVDEATRGVEKPKVDSTFVAGKSYTIDSMNLGSRRSCSPPSSASTT